MLKSHTPVVPTATECFCPRTCRVKAAKALYREYMKYVALASRNMSAAEVLRPSLVFRPNVIFIPWRVHGTNWFPAGHTNIQ